MIVVTHVARKEYGFDEKRNQNGSLVSRLLRKEELVGPSPISALHKQQNNNTTKQHLQLAEALSLSATNLETRMVTRGRKKKLSVPVKDGLHEEC
ncbi:hypothetical protein T4C_424 [Trichinella pseudospiralis]|uniref:Uncharacterized protein n=1 Tax=Trichinella pseudospiralis TaxID=6337 RepID=A0A0V1JPZ6_TRIPS|nr:hypothetical protein T4E_6726 [Trichinella pseudospiralis]KRZ37043.1 hypothetical protein T4C_424 [Trichinella pseudospiralis]